MLTVCTLLEVGGQIEDIKTVMKVVKGMPGFDKRRCEEWKEIFELWEDDEKWDWVWEEVVGGGIRG